MCKALLSDQALWIRAAKNDPDMSIREYAVESIIDQTELAEIIKQNEDISVRMAAMKRISDQTLITNLISFLANKQDDFLASVCIAFRDKYGLVELINKNANSLSVIIEKMYCSSPLEIEKLLKTSSRISMDALLALSNISNFHGYSYESYLDTSDQHGGQYFDKKVFGEIDVQFIRNIAREEYNKRVDERNLFLKHGNTPP